MGEWRQIFHSKILQLQGYEYITSFLNPIHCILKEVFVGRGGDKKAKLRQKNFESAMQRALRSTATCAILKAKDSRSSLGDTFNGTDEICYMHIVGKTTFCDRDVTRFTSVEYAAFASIYNVC